MADNRLKVAFLSLPQRTHAVLEYFISSTGQGDFLLSPDEQSEAGVFDFDNPESRHHWEHYHVQLGRPGVLLSVTQQQVPMTVWVQKPVTTGSMLEAAVRIKAGAWYVPPQQSLDLGYVPQPALERVVAAAPVTSPKSAPAAVSVPKSPARQATIQVPPVQQAAVEDCSPPAVASPKVAAAPITEEKHTVSTVGALPQVDKSGPLSVSETLPSKAKFKVKREWPRRVFGLISWTAGKCVSAIGIVWRAAARLVSRKDREKKTEIAAAISLPNKEALLRADTFPDIDLSSGVDRDSGDKLPLPPLPETPQAQPEITPILDRTVDVVSEPEKVVAEVAPETNSALAPAAAAKVRAAPSAVELANAPLFCGVREDIPGVEIARTAELFYPYDYYMVSALREAFMVGSKWRSPTRLDLDLGCVISVPAENCAYIDFPVDALFEQSVVSQPRRHKVRMVGVQEFAELESRLSSMTRLDRFDATLWKLGMTTAKGRLPVGTDVNKVFYLKCWPNMTRLEHSPFSLRIAALLATRGASLLDTARILDIPQRYVFAFYNAALATDIVTEDGAMVRRALRRVNRNQGRFLNLFKWLRG